MKLIVGLGNPGSEYELTPHNLGFLVVDRIADEQKVEVRNRQCRALTARTTIGQEQVILAKPETFMNLSGAAVRELVSKLEIVPDTDLIVIQDELDLPFGTLRIHRNRSSAGHNGIESIIDSLAKQRTENKPYFTHPPNKINRDSIMRSSHRKPLPSQ